MSPALGLPDYATRWFLVACRIALPFWAAFGWFYEFTPHGFRHESEIGDAPAVHHSNARRLDFAIIAVRRPAAVDALRSRSDIDPTSMVDVIQLYLALDQDGTALELLPKFCTDQPFGCNDLSVNPLYLPLRGKPAFDALVKRYDTTTQPLASATSAATSSL